MERDTVWVVARVTIALSLIAATIYLLTLPETVARVSAGASMLTILAMMARFYFNDKDDKDKP